MREITVIAFIAFLIAFIIWNKRSITWNAKIIEKIHSEGIPYRMGRGGLSVKSVPTYTIIFEREDDHSHISLNVPKEIYDSLSVGNDGVLVFKHELFARLEFVKFTCNREPKNKKKYSKRFQRRI